MAFFRRSDIRAIVGESCTEEIENKLMALHIGVVDTYKDQIEALKTERDKYKADADKLPDVQKELDGIKGGEDFKAKYDKEHQDFEAYKQQVVQEAETAKVKTAYRKLLRDKQISEKRLDAVMRATDFSKMKLDKDGNLADVDALKKAIDDEWADFKVTQRQRGAEVANPPSTDTGDGNDGIRQLTAKWHEARYGKTPQANNN